MSSLKSLPTQNDAETLFMGPVERIMRNIDDLYQGVDVTTGGVGICKIASDPLISLSVQKPRKRVSVMIIGNHSVGKSSFINWYIGEKVQRTGVAIETKGFYFVTSGRRRETLKGDATLRYFDHFAGLEKFERLVPNLFTEVCTSREKKFPCIDFIDTPGLVDGDIHYSFDVDAVILWLANHVDLILVFFDPIGQALTARTMDVVEKLSKNQSEKILFYMSKADQVEKENDRQRVLIQITQNITARIKSTHAFKLPTFYLPGNFGNSESSPVPNAIDDICEEIDKAVSLTMQKNLSSLKSDCTNLLQKIDSLLTDDIKKRKRNQEKARYGFSLLMSSWGVLGLIFVIIFHLGCVTFPWMVKMLSSQLKDFEQVAPFVPMIEDFVTSEQLDSREKYGYVLLILLIFYISLSFGAKFIWKALPVFSKSNLTTLRSYEYFLHSSLSICDDLYKDFFKELQEVEFNAK